jgi:hypothetical protein
MELYLFAWGTLAWTVTIAALWPLNVPLAWASYRIWHGNKPLDEETQDELWRRSTYGALAIAAASIAIVVLDYMLWNWAGLPAGLVHMIVLLALLPLATWLVMLFFAVEDFFEAFTLLLLYLYLPVFVLWLPNWLLGVWEPLLDFVKSWLEKPQA